MKQYYEAREILPVDTMETGEFIRIDITDGTDKEKASILQSIKDIMSGKKYTLKLHNCYHEDGGACEVKAL